MFQQIAKTRSAVGTLAGDLLVLFKVRIVLLLVLSAVAGAMIAARGRPQLGDLLVLILAGSITAAGSSALNEYLERDRDALMKRTRRRPLVQGTLPAEGLVPYLALTMIFAPALLLWRADAALAWFLLLGAGIYVGVYTVWLKPRTSLNIVIGGAAGSCAVLSGGAAVHAWADPGVVLLAGLLFFWTPIHFWALAHVYRDDYARAGVPMLPVIASARRSAGWGLAHGLVAAVLAIALAFRPGLGLVYGVPAALASSALVLRGVQFLLVPSNRLAWLLFHFSNLFLAAVLVAACVATLVG